MIYQLVANSRHRLTFSGYQRYRYTPYFRARLQRSPARDEVLLSRKPETRKIK